MSIQVERRTVFENRKTGERYVIAFPRLDSYRLVSVDTEDRRWVKKQNLTKSYKRVEAPPSEPAVQPKRPQLQEDEGPQPLMPSWPPDVAGGSLSGKASMEFPRDTYGPDPSAPLSAFVTSTSGTNAPPTSGDAHGRPLGPSEDAARQLSASPSPEDSWQWKSWPVVAGVAFALLLTAVIVLYAIGAS